MNITVTKSGMLIPVNDASQCVTIYLRQNRNVVEKVFARLCNREDAMHWLYVDLCSFQGETLEFSVEANESENVKNEEHHVMWDYQMLEKQVVWSEPPTDNQRDAKLRPQIHYTARTGWINDPNGLCYYDGHYHLYYQYTPGALEPIWDNMHWGHAVSKDMIHWRECSPVNRYPCAFSGSAFVRRDTGKLCIAWNHSISESEDGGFSFRKLTEVERSRGSDPKVFYHEESNQYVSIDLYFSKDGPRPDSFIFSVSSDLKNWTETDILEGWFECPELFCLPIEGTTEKKWILYSGDAAYQIGEFDGRYFRADPIEEDRRDAYRPLRPYMSTPSFRNKYNGQWSNYLQENSTQDCVYACQVFNELQDGRSIRMGWYRINYAKKGASFNQCMIFPQELSLKQTGFGVRLCVQPIREVKALRKKEIKLSAGEKFSQADNVAWEVCAKLSKGQTITINEFTFEYHGNKLMIAQKEQPEFDIPVACPNEPLKLHILTDIGCFESYVGEGEIYIPLRPEKFDAGITVLLEGEGDGDACVYALSTSDIKEGVTA